MKNISKLKFVISLTVLSASNAFALIDVPTLRFGLGMAPLKFTIGNSTTGVVPTPTALSSKGTLNPMFLWDIPSLRMRLGTHFQADLGSPYGFVTVSGVGATAIFYPTGLSSSREVGDNFTEVIKTKISPFAQVSITPVKVSISQTAKPEDNIQKIYVNGSTVEFSFGGGVDYPFADDLIGFIGAHYRSASLSNDDGNVAYSGISILGGIMTNFY